MEKSFKSDFENGLVHNQFRLLQISTHDSTGGAARVALDLHRSFLARGVDARLAVQEKFMVDDDRIIKIQNDAHRSLFARFLIKRAEKLENAKVRGAWRAGMMLRSVAEPKRTWDISQGIEDFHFPATEHLIDLHPQADLIHCHNLHGDFFDLRQLPQLSRQLPVVLTLHDAWLLSGHCAHSMECDRWKHGCGECPDLNLYPKVKKDRTHFNWLRKREIYKRSRLYVVTPCKWLMDKVEESILFQAVIGQRIIPNGVDLSVFRQADTQQTKERLGLPLNRFVILVSGSVFRENPAQDLEILKRILSLVKAEMQGICLVLGSNFPEQYVRNWEIRAVPFQQDRKSVADYFQASDLFLHPSKADTFPMAVLEALSCGVPVIATGVGGIPEQIRGLSGVWESTGSPTYEREQATGVLLKSGDLSGFTNALDCFMQNQSLRQRIGQNAAADASQRFSLDRAVDAYLDLHHEMLRGPH